MSDFKGRHFEAEIVLWAVRWYCRYGVSYRDLEQMMGERGVLVDHSTIYRWVQRYAPEIEKRLRWQWRGPRSTSWRVDETYVKVRGRWAYLYRALDKHGNTIEFYLSPTRNTAAAKRFLGKALKGLKNWEKPYVINTDKAPTYAAALAELKAQGKCPHDTVHRQVKYLNNVIEADHGKLKQLIRPVRGFKTLKTAYATIKASANDRTLVDTVEADPLHVQLARRNIRNAGLDDRITVHEGDFLTVMPSLKGLYDMIFFDGFSPRVEVIEGARARLRSDGVLVCANLPYTGADDKRRLDTEFSRATHWSHVGEIEGGATEIFQKL